LVVTVAHVVDGVATIDLGAGDKTTFGQVVGIDDSTDVALVKAASPIAGHIFRFASSVPPVGTSLGVIGYPEGVSESFSQGVVSGLNRTITVDGSARSNMIQTDAPLNPGNSGGPMLTLNGQVIGLVDAGDTEAQGLSYAVPATTAAPLVSEWMTRPSPSPLASCGSGPPPTGAAPGGSSGAQGTSLPITLAPPTDTLNWTGFVITPASCRYSIDSVGQVSAVTTGSVTVPETTGVVVGQIEAWILDSSGNVVAYGFPAYLPQTAGSYNWTVSTFINNIAGDGGTPSSCVVEGIDPSLPWDQPQS